MGVCMYVRVYTYRYTYVCMYVCMFAGMYVCMYVCTYVHMYAGASLNITQREHGRERSQTERPPIRKHARAQEYTHTYIEATTHVHTQGA